MIYHLVVLRPFQGFWRGDVIKDAATVQDVLAGPQAGFVVRVSAGKE